MAEIKSIEQLLYFMKGHIQLSRYDEGFIDNISHANQVTTNQVVLLHSLISKYRRQFAKHELFAEKLVELPWNVTVVESSPKYTEGHVSIINDVIYFKCPFNRNFIDAFNKTTLNNFTFNKVKKQYESPYNVYCLKILVQTAKKFFKNINYCDQTKEILSKLDEYKDMMYWQPTLIQTKDNVYIAATNTALDEALGTLQLSTNINTLLTLSKYGVNIDESFYINDDKLKFICQYNATIEQADIPTMINWLREINCDMVYLSGVSPVNPIKNKLIGHLNNCEIKYLDFHEVVPPHEKNFKCPVYIKFKKFADDPAGLLRVAKIITIVNSTPIQTK